MSSGREFKSRVLGLSLTREFLKHVERTCVPLRPASSLRLDIIKRAAELTATLLLVGHRVSSVFPMQVKLKFLSHVQLFLPNGLQSLWNSLGQNTRVGSLSLLQGKGIFPTQGLNAGPPHCRRILYQLSHEGRPRILEWVAYPFPTRSSWPRNWTGVSCIAGGFFTNWREQLYFHPSESYMLLKLLIPSCSYIIIPPPSVNLLLTLNSQPHWPQSQQFR